MKKKIKLIQLSFAFLLIMVANSCDNIGVRNTPTPTPTPSIYPDDQIKFIEELRALKTDNSTGNSVLDHEAAERRNSYYEQKFKVQDWAAIINSISESYPFDKSTYHISAVAYDGWKVELNLNSLSIDEVKKIRKDQIIKFCGDRTGKNDFMTGEDEYNVSSYVLVD